MEILLRNDHFHSLGASRSSQLLIIMKITATLFFSILLLCSSFNSTALQSLDGTLDSLATSDQENLVKVFPYLDYLDSFSLDNVRELERTRVLLDEKNIDGGRFLFTLFDHYWNKQVLDFNNVDTLQKALRIAEIFSVADKYLPEDVFVYNAVSGLIFNAIADTLQQLINTDQVSVSDSKIDHLIYLLERHQYYIDVRENNWSKLWRYTQEGRFGYIWHKFNSTYKKQFYIALAIMVFLLAGGIWLFIRKRKRKILLSQNKK